MNLVGKIFVVLILVASTVFMTLGSMVYATHRLTGMKKSSVRTATTR